MPVKRKTKKKKIKKQQSQLMRLLSSAVVIIVIFALLFVLYNRKSPKVQPAKIIKKQSTELVQDKIPADLLKATWVNSADGALLAFKKEGTYSIDFPSVDGSTLITGKYSYLNNEIHFIGPLKDNYCSDIEGIYTIKIEDDKLNLHTVKDICIARKNHFTEGWFRL